MLDTARFLADLEELHNHASKQGRRVRSAARQQPCCVQLGSAGVHVPARGGELRVGASAAPRPPAGAPCRHAHPGLSAAAQCFANFTGSALEFARQSGADNATMDAPTNAILFTAQHPDKGAVLDILGARLEGDTVLLSVLLVHEPEMVRRPHCGGWLRRCRCRPRVLCAGVHAGPSCASAHPPQHRCRRVPATIARQLATLFTTTSLPPAPPPRWRWSTCCPPPARGAP